uniref:Uncharacterized protein n=1 Tax=Siphoviridae sp. ctTBR23 TaxID=2825515 RepID=A0A8S5P142_9CAUD|nr:MAG TPA: hypothetical protein [Siphoviridae sp. ctTBR23]DAR27045.1 MAG TPA: hypothetical protein [Caudoviricetes sp.]
MLYLWLFIQSVFKFPQSIGLSLYHVLLHLGMRHSCQLYCLPTQLLVSEPA